MYDNSTSMNTIVCPHCNKTFEMSDAFRHQIEEEVLKIEQNKHKLELEELRKDVEEKARKKIEEELGLQMKNQEEEEIADHIDGIRVKL